MQTETQTAMVDVCPRCAEVIDQRARQESRSSTLWIAAIFGGFLCFVLGVYFFLVRPEMQKHEKFRQDMEKQQQEFRKKHFGE
jgi:hypothetical protein